MPQHREFPRLRGGGKALLCDTGKVGPKLGSAGIGQVSDLIGSIMQVTSVRGERVDGRATFGAHHFKEGLNADGASHGVVFWFSLSSGTSTDISVFRGSTRVANAYIAP